MKKLRNFIDWLENFLEKKILLWKVLALSLLVLLALFGMWRGRRVFPDVHSSHSGTMTTRSMVTYLEKVNEVVFLTVGIKEIETQTNNKTIPWTQIGIPATEKKAIIILNYATKLGIKEAVKINEIGDNTFEISIPKFEFIGVHLDEEEPYQLYDSRKGILSLATEDIDTAALATQKLSSESQSDYLKKYDKLLKESATNYYTRLFKSIDPDIKLEFKFEK